MQEEDGVIYEEEGSWDGNVLANIGVGFIQVQEGDQQNAPQGAVRNMFVWRKRCTHAQMTVLDQTPTTFTYQSTSMKTKYT